MQEQLQNKYHSYHFYYTIVYLFFYLELALLYILLYSQAVKHEDQIYGL